MAHERDALLERASYLEDELLDVLVASSRSTPSTPSCARRRSTRTTAPRPRRERVRERDEADAALAALDAARPAIASEVPPRSSPATRRWRAGWTASAPRGSSTDGAARAA